MARRTILSLSFAIAAAIVVATACGPAGFQSSTVIDSVRILATRADNDKSFAHPGDSVTLETLTVDGRTTKTPPAVTYWLPFVCMNPLDDLYYACFAQTAGGGAGDAGSSSTGGGSLASLLVPGTDITQVLPTGPYSLTIPTDIIAKHPVVEGTTPYGLVMVFNIACAGRVKVVAIDAAGGPQQVPIGCFDDAGKALGPDQYVIGFSRVYVYETNKNLNPAIAGFFFKGTEIDAGGAGSTSVPSPISVKVPACKGGCDPVKIDIDVPESSWAPNHKSIWVDYYALGGHLGDDAKLLYDISAGRLSDSANQVTYVPPDAPGEATIWAVVHDNNDGVTWLQVNVTAE